MLGEQVRPPSGRDFEVFETVIVGGKTSREAAGRFRLSQTRICQLVEKVRVWQAEVLPAEAPLSETQRLNYAKVVASERLNYLYCEMMEAWRRSQGEVKKIRSARFGDEVTTTTTSCGDPKYLLAAMRLATAQAEFGVATGLPCQPEEEESGRVGCAHQEPDDDQNSGRPEARPKNHPDRGCSTETQSQPAKISAVARDAAVTAGDDSVSATLTPRQALAREQLFAPVQAADAMGESSRVTQLQVSPDELGLSVEAILAKQQRRELKRARRAG